MVSNFAKSSRALPSSVVGRLPFNASVSSFSACTMASAGVAVEFVMCLCLNRTVSVILTTPVPLTHTS